VAALTGQVALVTGATGFIGSHLCERLLANGNEVHAVSRRNQSGARKGVRWWQADLAEMADVRKLLNGSKPDLIFHLASQVSGSRDLSMVESTFHNNLMTTVNLLTVATELACRRIVLTGSLEEPDAGDPDNTPSSPYSITKWASSAYGRMFYALYQLPVVILRLFMVYGPGQSDLRKIVPYVILSALKGETPKLTSGVRPIDWIYIDDVVEGLCLAADAKDIEGSTLDIGSGNLVPIRTVVEKLIHITGSKVVPLFGALADRPLEQVRIADAANSYAKIGWRPRTSIDAGLELTVNWYTEEFKAGSFRSVST
jgi:UDP-glucose 4-epimerase